MHHGLPRLVGIQFMASQASYGDSRRQSSDQRHRYHLGTCWRCKASDSTLDEGEALGVGPSCVCACSVMSDSLRPREPQPTRLLCPRDSPGENLGVGCHLLLLGIFPTQGSKPASPGAPALVAGFLTAEPPGKPIY